jgi:S1-C subfamily serine protease
MRIMNDTYSSASGSRRPPSSGAKWGVLIGLLLAVVALWILRSPGRRPPAEPRAIMPRGDLAEEEKSMIALFRQASPSVVHITTLAVRQDAFSFDVLQIPQGTGSGFIWDADGHIVTNFHVIQDADAATVTMAEHSNWKAHLVGAYPDKDLAVLRVDAPRENLYPIPIGTSHDLQVGQKVFAIGNPFGLDQSLTTGIISALGREIQSVTRRPIRDMIQTDAAINPGNSGGPLLDSAGRLIGVNTAIYSPSGVSAGIGFAIPVDEVNRLVPQLIRHGRVIRPGLGVQVAPDRLAAELGLSGVLILGIVPDGPAAKAGLRATRRVQGGRIELGDVIAAIDGQGVRSVEELLTALDRYQVGARVKVTLLRDGGEVVIEVVLESVS